MSEGRRPLPEPLPRGPFRHINATKNAVLSALERVLEERASLNKALRAALTEDETRKILEAFEALVRWHINQGLMDAYWADRYPARAYVPAPVPVDEPEARVPTRRVSAVQRKVDASDLPATPEVLEALKKPG